MEYLINTLVWVLGVYGMSTIIVHSQIARPFRESLTYYPDREYDKHGNLIAANHRKGFLGFLGKLVHCILCTGFWVGILWGQCYWSPLESLDSHWIVNTLFTGCLGSATTWLIYLKVYPLMEGK